jgi:hypothetical protein
LSRFKFTEKIKMKEKIALILLVFCCFKSSFSQENQFLLGTQFPIYYTVGYEEKLKNKLFLTLQFGWIDQPYTGILIDQAKKNGLANELAEVTTNSFKNGYNFQPTLKFKFKHFYFGAFYSLGILNAAKIDYQKVADFYNVVLPEEIDIPGTNSSIDFPDIEVGMQSLLHNGGLLIGKEFRFKNPKFAIGVELSFTKILGSKTKLILSEYGEYISQKIIDDLNSDLNNYYVKDGNIPTLNLFFMYRFNKSIHGLIKGK